MKSRFAALSIPCITPSIDTRQNPAPTVQASKHPLHRSCSPHLVALLLAASIGMLGSANPASADAGTHGRTLYSAGFEQPKFLGGEQLEGLDGWSTPPRSLDFPPNLNPMAAKITGAAGRRGEQSIEVRGAELLPLGVDNPYDAVGSYRKQLDYTVSRDRQIVRIEADLLLETNQPKTKGDFFGLTIAARSADGKNLGELGLTSDLKVDGYKFNAGTADSTPWVFKDLTSFNRWHRVAIQLDYLNRKTSYFMDGQSLGQPTDFDEDTGNVLARVAMVVYARVDGDKTGDNETGRPSLRSNYAARFDNFKVSVGRDPQEKMSSADDEKD